MADRKTSQYTRTNTINAGDLIEIIRTANGTTDDANLAIEKTDFDAYILSVVGTTSYTTLVIASGVTGTISLGVLATYEGFKVEFIIGQNDARFSGDIELVYDNLSPVVIPPNGAGDDSLVDYDNGLNLEDAVISGGNFVWKLKNNTGSNITIKYRIAESKPAI